MLRYHTYIFLCVCIYVCIIIRPILLMAKDNIFNRIYSVWVLKYVMYHQKIVNVSNSTYENIEDAI